VADEAKAKPRGKIRGGFASRVREMPEINCDDEQYRGFARKLALCQFRSLRMLQTASVHAAAFVPSSRFGQIRARRRDGIVPISPLFAIAKHPLRRNNKSRFLFLLQVRPREKCSSDRTFAEFDSRFAFVDCQSSREGRGSVSGVA